MSNIIPTPRILSYAELYENNDPAGSFISTPVAGTYYKWVTASVGAQSGSSTLIASAVTSNITVGANGAGIYRVTFSVTVSDSNNSTIHACIHVDGAPTHAIGAAKVGNSGDQVCISGIHIAQLSVGQIIDLRFANDINASHVDVYHAALDMNRL